MGQTEATRQSDFTTPPVAGQIAVLAVSGSAGSQDLRLIGNQTPDGSSATGTVGLPGHYAMLEADGGDVYVIFGKDAASVTAANAPNSSTTGVNVAGCCVKIPSGGTMNVKLRAGASGHNFVGYVTASGNATLRIAQASP